ncbi:hypothetical protein VTO42DRAFT_1370 [Malbranchea cinnamomea]
MAPRALSSFRLLSFDIYGTLIDWETGIQEALKPLAARLDASNPLKSDLLALGSAFNKHERATQTQNPKLTYDLVLKESYKALARELAALPDATAENSDVDALLDLEGTAFAESIARWPAFPDTVAAMRRLKQRGFKLVPLSNVDHASFRKSVYGPMRGLHEGMDPNKPFFDAVYTAQDIGSYKPDLRNFEYLLEHVKADFGVEKEEILHVAQSLFHDHEPAKKIGLQSVWIARGEGGVSGMGGDVEEYTGGENPKVAFGWKFNNLAELADAIDKEVKERATRE